MGVGAAGGGGEGGQEQGGDIKISVHLTTQKGCQASVLSLPGLGSAEFFQPLKSFPNLMDLKLTYVPLRFFV